MELIDIMCIVLFSSGVFCFFYFLGRLFFDKDETPNEYILCAAIWYENLPTTTYPPVNIEKGMVICGQRHHNCIDVIYTLAKLRSVSVGSEDEVTGKSTQGFLTNKNRFVDRKEALKIAIEADQVDKDKLGNPMIGLFSEDLY